MRLIDHVIRSSLSEAVDRAGGVLAFSRRIGVAHSTVLFWLTGKTRRINSDLWRGRVYPEIESYLAENLREVDLGVVREKYADSLDGVFGEKQVLSVPVVREADMMNYDPVMESVRGFAEKFACEKAMFLCNARKRCFAVKLEDCDSLLSGCRETLLLCAADERVKNDAFAVLRMRGGERLRVCRVLCAGDSVVLEPFPGAEASEKWNYREDRGRVEWMFPALWIKVICPSGAAR